jgi:redox-sensitive bicupin YhaK (pirin superfamily)
MHTRRTLLAGLAAIPAVGLMASQWARIQHRLPRRVLSVFPGMPTEDGAGVRLSRVIGQPALRMLDPFLMLDEFKSDKAEDYIAGFPDHPHRGFETVTIMLDGAMEHRDSVGNRGLLSPGSIQWMTAGSGIVHSETPKQVEGLMWGYQLWVNLPAAKKWSKPRYQDIQANAVPTVDIADARVRVMAGAVGGARGPVDGVAVAPQLLDVTLEEGARFEHDLPPYHTAFAYVADGELRLGEPATTVPRGHLAVLGTGDRVIATGRSRFLLFAGEPIGEPVARRGPFVMNTDAEIQQAYDDYRSGRLVRG